MLKMVRFRIVLLVGISALWITQNSFAGSSSSKPLVSPELLKHAKLKMLWDNELPIKKNESLDRLLLFGNRIYAVSDRNFVLSMNQKNGKIHKGSWDRNGRIYNHQPLDKEKIRPMLTECLKKI